MNISETGGNVCNAYYILCTILKLKIKKITNQIKIYLENNKIIFYRNICDFRQKRLTADHAKLNVA